jgi:hypothetical protein
MNLKTRRHHSRNRRSTALVTVLALVTILTLLLLAYLNLMRVDRLATRNYAQGIRAEEMSHGAMDFIIGQLRAEMAAGAAPITEGNYSLYTNIVSTNIEPGAIGTTATVPALIKISTNGLGVYSGAPAEDTAVAASTATSSANDRSINLGRWAQPGFGTLPFAPNWFLLGSSGVTNAASATVQGRFAYAIYNLGSLLDVNVAGYPSSLSAAQQKALQGSLPGVDLSTLPGLNQTTVDALIQTFRNRTSAASATAYTNQVLNVDSTNGFMTVSPGDDTFLSQQDFLAYTKLNGLSGVTTNLTTFSRSINGPTWAPTTNAGTVNVQTITRTFIGGAALGALYNATTTPNVPLDFDYQANATAPSSTNPNFLSQTVIATFTRFNSDPTSTPVQAVVGEPLVLKRFPLDRLSWLTYQGPIATAGGALSSAPGMSTIVAQLNAAGIPSTYLQQGTPQNILMCFGLAWDSVNKLWVYTSPKPGNGGGIFTSGNSDGPATSQLAANTIKTLAVVASENREPDFFELLKAGILRGSVGIHPSVDSPTFMLLPSDITPEGQIFQIGANIIDQYDADDYPTLIRAYMPVVMREINPATLVYSYGTGTALTPTDFAGVESVPYLSQFRYRVYRPQVDQGNLPGRPNVQASLVPQFWNPHQNAGISSSLHPSNFRIKQTFGIIRAWLKTFIVVTNSQGVPQKVPGPNSYYTSPGSQWPSPSGIQPIIEFSGASTFSSPAFLKPSDVIKGGTSPTENQVRPAITEAVGGNPPPNSPDPAGFVGFWLGEASGVDNTPYDKDVWAANGGTPALTDPALPFDPTQTATQIGLYQAFGAANANAPLPESDPFWKGDTVSAAADDGEHYAIFELQYQDPTDNSVWKTYQRFDDLFTLDFETYDFETMYPSMTDEYDSFVLGRLDPRGSRFGLMQISNNGNSIYGWGNVSAQNVPLSPPSTYYNTTMSGAWGGMWVSTGNPVGPDPGNESGAKFVTGWIPPPGPGLGALSPYGQIMDNITSGQYFTDNDLVDRRGDADSAAGVNPLTNPSAQPVMLNRPFTSTGDLGYVYRDLPFKTLDFFSANSGDSALLDLFCVHESPVVVAGKVNLNSNNSAVLAQLLTGGTQVEPVNGNNATTLSSANATSIANALVSASQATPFTGLWDLPGFLATGTVGDTLQNTKTQMEVVPRQLANVADTRCWNLLIDVVSQSGHYPTGITNPDQFIVEGERRYWLRLAIDRWTGKIVDEQLEPVFE